MRRLYTKLEQGLTQTAHLWPDLARAYRWIDKLRTILANPDGQDGAAVRRRLFAFLAALARWQHQLTTLPLAITHLRKICRSYWQGLFHCYDLPNLPRTNNDLEHLFGRYRHLERRISGHKRVRGAIVITGSVRLAAAIATLNRPFSPDELRSVDLDRWRAARDAVESHRHKRRQQRRFRRDPLTFLSRLEQLAIKLTLPA